MTDRKLKQTDSGWACSDCDWALASPDAPTSADVQRAFQAHRCGHYGKKKSREDVNQAAFRIVREATREE